MAPFTTHQVAALLSVSLPTVVNWIKAGKLEAYKTPGGHRRIKPSALKSFCQRFEMPLPEPLQRGGVAQSGAPGPVILVASYEHDFAEVLHDFIEIKVEAPVRIVESALQTGILLGENAGGVLIVDQAHSGVDPLEAKELLQGRFEVLVLTASQDDAQRLNGLGISGTLSRSSEFEAICGAVYNSLRLLSAKD